MTNTTEKESNYQNLDKMSIGEILININQEDHTVATSVQRSLPQIEALTQATVTAMKQGGRLFYIRAG
ncbi:MAG TPA: hypothetical protein VKZ78_05050, partial [Sphingobacteriaceae bacterium]|nr:hypothetical protein [Sphingobacteriaceae bacterium]